MFQLLEIFLAMLCCGRKKENLDQATRILPSGAKEKTEATPGEASQSGVELPTGRDQPRRVEGGGGGGERGGGGGGGGSGGKGGNGVIDMRIKSIERFVDCSFVERVEVVKRPGQTLGLYVREGNGSDRRDGVFISHVAAGSAVERNGLLRVGEEILTVDAVDVTGMSIDDVVTLMSIPSRLVLTIRTQQSSCKNLSRPSLPMGEGRAGGKGHGGETVRVFHAPAATFSREFSRPGTTGLKRIQMELKEEEEEKKERRGILRRHHEPEARYAEPEMTKQTPVSGRTTYEPFRSWDRRPARYRPDYSSDTDAQFVRMDPPSDWIHSGAQRVPKKASMDPVEYLEMKELKIPGSRRRDDKMTDLSPVTGGQEATSELLPVPRTRCNSLPDIENGSAKDELKHWLKKLDKLSLELQEFNNRISMTSPTRDEAETTTAPPIDVPTIHRSTGSRKPDSYTSQEYRSWIYNRQSSLESPSHHRHEIPISSSSAFHRKTKTLDSKFTSCHDPERPASSPRDPPVIRIRPPEPKAPGLARAKTVDGRLSTALGGDLLSLPRTPLTIDPDEFRTHSVPTPIRPEESQRPPRQFDGQLYIHIYCGHGLRTTRTTLRDLYCVVCIDGLNKARTAVRSGAINFDWDEDFEVELDAARILSLSVYNWDPVVKQRLCFSSSLTLEELFTAGETRQRLALRLEPDGVVYLDLVYMDLSIRFQRKPSSSSSSQGTFGGRLQGIVARDASEDGVPLVVRRCVEEIERRGVDGVGLYRLCGSARRQAQLKAELEKDPVRVDLSPRNVPDISVLTGVLKDFFRELAEPLLTNDLHHLLMDAINVQIAGDPRGNAGLMLSIVDCLPRENLNTLRFLFNHLRRVIRKRDDNKMNALTIASIFGPILICPAYRLVKQAIDLQKQVDVVYYLLDIWPDSA